MLDIWILNYKMVLTWNEVDRYELIAWGILEQREYYQKAGVIVALVCYYSACFRSEKISLPYEIISNYFYEYNGIQLFVVFDCFTS